MASTPPSLFHRLVVQLSTTGTGFMADSSYVNHVMSSYPTIFHNSGSCWSLITNSIGTASLLSTYLTLSENVAWDNGENVPGAQSLKSPSMMVKSKSTFFSLIPGIMDSNTNSLIIFLPDGSSFKVHCTLFHQRNSSLLIKVRFAINSCMQLVCMVTDVYEEVEGQVKFLTTSEESKHAHLPVCRNNRTEDTSCKRTRLFVRTALDRNKEVLKLELVQRLLVFQVWQLMMKQELRQEGGCEWSVENIVKYVRGDCTIDDKKVLSMVAAYPAIFLQPPTAQIALHTSTHSYWAQLLSVCSNIVPVHGHSQLPVSPVNLRVTMSNNVVVLRDLQGMVLPRDQTQDNRFSVRFRLSETEDGFSVMLHNSRLKVPAEGKVIPLTLVLQVHTARVVVVGTMGSWKQFEVNWPKTQISVRVETCLTDDLELLLDDAPILSSVVCQEEIVTLEE